MSVSVSAENLSTDAQSCDGGSMCLELALEGERLCKAGDCRAGVAFFQAAIQAGTDDLRTLSAIYSQLGNAYFYLGDYNKAMQYHKHDLTLARTMNDKLGEAKASGNLGNTLKVMGKFTEAIQCCKRHLEISRSLGDRLSEGRALYNLGNVYHAQGKQLGRVGQNDPGHFPQEVRDCLLQAVSYYEENLELMRSLNDRQAMGRACGNLGNTCYLLGEFARAIRYHTERLGIARDFGDKPAERRANSNLANSHIFLGQFENAADHYKRTLALAEELGDSAVEAQACYSLGNTYTLLREYRAAEQYHARHLAAAQKLRDRVGEGRACWSLGNAHAALGNHEKALYYANEHHTISKELGDVLGMATALMNISDLRKVLGLPAEEQPVPPTACDDNSPKTPFNALRVRRQSMEQLSLIPITPDVKGKSSEERSEIGRTDSEEGPESFFEQLSRCQAARYDDQRATLHGKENRPKPQPKLQRSQSSGNKHSSDEITSSNDEFVELLSSMQCDRIDSQRAQLAPPPKKKAVKKGQGRGAAGASGSGGGGDASSLPGGSTTSTLPERDFIELLQRVQGSRLDEQRSELPPRPLPNPMPDEPATTSRAFRGPGDRNPGHTVINQLVPDENFINALINFQDTRFNDQRCEIPAPRPPARREDDDGAGGP